MSVRTVVEKKLPSRSPPVTRVAPCSTARLTWSSRRSLAASEDSGPIGGVRRAGILRLDRRERGRELLEERLVELVDHDEALRRVARLAGVLEPRAHGRLDGGVEVVGAQEDERIRASELEHDLLEVAPGDLGDRGAGALRSGQRHAAHARVADHPLDLLVGRVDVDVGVRREAGLLEDLLHRRRRLGALRARA